VNSPLLAPRAVITALGVIVLALLAGYLIGRTPGDVVSSSLDKADSGTPSAETVQYTLKDGETAASVASDLSHLGVIDSASQFELLARLTGVQDKLRAGTYTLHKGASAAIVVDKLSLTSDFPALHVTFPEGIRIEQMAVLAEKAGFGTQQQFLDAVKNAKPPPGIAAMEPAAGAVPQYRLQGFLFPDTYILPEGSTASDLVAMMLQTFVDKFTPALQEQARQHGLTPYQALTLASIVEREAVLDSERPIIAGVFMNRLAKGDTLGADPTTQFAVALDPANVAKYGWWKQGLSEADLAIDSPYNTRKNPGLPPGPITNPGLKSIEAACNPTKTDYYYFVADSKKGDGSHLFSVTLEQQNANIAAQGGP
jgi:UPF0755 protein